MANVVKVAQISDVPPGQAKTVTAGDQRIALCNVEGTFYAVDDLCTHDYGPLGEGDLYGAEIECPRHGAIFDVRTGEVIALPAMKPLNTYEIRVDGEDISIVLP